MGSVVLFLHLVGVFVFAGGIAVAGVAFESARRRERPMEIALLLGLARTAVPFVLVGAALVLGCGLWLVGLERDIGYGDAWVDASIVLFVAALALGAWGGRAPRRARQLATRLAEEGKPADATLRALLDDQRSRLVNYTSSALVVAILALMVFKP